MMGSKYVTVLLASVLSVSIIGIQSKEPVFVFIYGAVVASVFMIVSLPVSLVADLLAMNIRYLGPVYSGMLQILLTFVVLSPFIIAFTLAFTSHPADNFLDFLHYTQPFWRLIAINSSMFWISDLLVKLMFKKFLRPAD
ncbi:hypothetical protein ACI7RC_10280 [Brevibacillus sp. B_LB10_24]|uniref:hypothetical protein n=1 Tax=Brevibacillus sp. B_LB10_24 TaxID=3380645 RepID=UPI0038BB377A